MDRIVTRLVLGVALLAAIGSVTIVVVRRQDTAVQATPRSSVLRMRLFEAEFRKRAVTVVMPVYPERSLRRGVGGVAVARVVTDQAGVVTEVDILESPDRYVGAAVNAAVRSWTFRPDETPEGKTYGLIGKLTFYFSSRDGKGRVASPEDLRKPDYSDRMLEGTALTGVAQ